MGPTERTWLHSPSRRKALTALAGVVASSPLLGSRVSAQLDPRPLRDHKRWPGLDEMMTAFDFEPVMFANVPQAVYDYTAHGDGSEFTLRRNRQAFEWVDVVGGKAIDSSRVDLSCELFGMRLKYPIMVAPTATQLPLHPDAESGMYRAATEAANTPMVVSQNTSTPIDKIASAAKGPLWWQFYPVNSIENSKEILDRALTAGCAAIVVTVDQQASYYERSLHSRNLGGRGTGRGGRGGAASATTAGAGPARYRLTAGRLWYTWDYLDQIRRIVKVPLIVKGIVTAEDAALCIEHGVDGVIVSNHGGRSMDYGPSTLEVLPEIAAVVNRRIPVLIDSGFRRGADILKALALGADAVLLGRATRWALAAFGAPGAQRLLEIMQRELVDAAATAGRPTRASIDASTVRARFV
jgi:4-hydroxymandelate oxidase